MSKSNLFGVAVFIAILVFVVLNNLDLRHRRDSQIRAHAEQGQEYCEALNNHIRRDNEAKLRSRQLMETVLVEAQDGKPRTPEQLRRLALFLDSIYYQTKTIEC